MFKKLLVILLATFTLGCAHLTAAPTNNTLVGIYVTNHYSVNEVLPFSNAVAFKPTSKEDLTSYLQVINSRAVPVVEVSDLFLRDSIFQFNYNSTVELANTLNGTEHTGRIVIMLDEILWKVRRNCTNGSVTACNDVSNNYTQSIHDVNRVIALLKSRVSGVEVFHVESYAELYLQWIERGKLTLLYNAEHLGFNCYGPINGCGNSELGVPPIAIFDYLTVIYNSIAENNSSAKILLVPGSFMNESGLPTEQDTLNHFNGYLNIFDTYRDYASGFGAFAWDSFVENGEHFTGTRDLHAIRQTIEDALKLRAGK